MQTSHADNITEPGNGLNKYENESYRNNGNDSLSISVDICLTSYCLPIAITLSTISIVGIVTNLIVIVVIGRDKRLHQPTFVIICSLAVADVSFLLARYPRYIIKGYVSKEIPNEYYITIKLVLDVAGLLAGSSSIIHVVFLSALRYFIVVHPFRSHVLLTNRRIFVMSVLLWTFGAGISALYTYSILLKGADNSTLKEVTNIVITIFMSILPVALISILHLLKAKVLLKSISNCATETVRNMSRVVTFIIISFIVTTTPSNVIDVMILSFGYYYTKTRWFFVISQVARVFLFLNFAINPFIYFVHSSQLQKSISRCCGKRRHIRSSSSGFNHQRSSTIASTILPDEPNCIQLQSCKQLSIPND